MKIAPSFDLSQANQTGEQNVPVSAAMLQPAVTFGRILGYSTGEGPLVDFPGNTSGVLLCARSVCAVTRQSVGAEAVLGFEGGDPTRPVILGLVQPPPVQQEQDGDTHPQPEPLEVAADGNRLTLSAKEEIVLRCGLASITLTRAGKILIRGEYLLSRSAGTNRVKGASVQIN